MRIVAITNQKGGSGKTTTAVNLAAALGEKKRKVLIVDLDPQASASSWYAVKDGSRGLLDVFVHNTPLSDLVQLTQASNVEIVPSSSWLVGAEKALAGEVGSETILRRQLQLLPPDRWDYLLVDCPPSLGILTVNALTAVREVVVPVEAHVMALDGLAQLLKTVEVAKERLNPELKISGILPCRVDARTRHALEVVEQLRERFGKLVYRVIIRENVRLAECPSFKQPITEYDTRSYGAADYRALAKAVIKQERS
ncbi:ParA family protein [Candidatus Acetothermia bacterium]|nr:ParA family protein [Candidatus Acetothermia bacterium]MBI3460005.1 ParA family protein [Candidatus Acetothermia bacterium]